MNHKILFLVFLIGTFAQAQRFGYVDTDYVLNQLSTYKQAQQRVNNQAQTWQKEIENKQVELEEMVATFESEKILLSEEQLKAKQEELSEKRKAIKALQEKRYGPEGDLITTRKKLVKPIQDQVWNAVKKVADKRKYSFVFDKGSELIMIYSDPKYDISEEVLKVLNPKSKK